MRDQEDICPVCGYLLCEGNHPHRYEFCKACGKRTIFVTAPNYEAPYICTEAHVDDKEMCAVCSVAVQSGDILRCIVVKGKIYKLLCYRCAPHESSFRDG